MWVESRAPAGLAVSGVVQDSRRAEPGDLFLVWKGTEVDAHDYLEQARRRGAAAAIVERWVENVALPQLRVSDGRRAAALVAHEVLGRPSDRLHLTGVTGTNGKTTVAWLLRHLVAGQGPAVALGTLGLVDEEGRLRPETGGLTTPGPVELTLRLAEAVEAGVEAVVLETSSHALDQRRLDGLAFDTACFTNLSRDHLDYHGSWEAYRRAKAHLVDLLRETGAGVVVNGDDPAWSALPAIPGQLLVTRVTTTGERTEPRAFEAPPAGERRGDLKLLEVELTGEGSRFSVEWEGAALEGELPLLGRFNAENAATALGAALLQDVPLEEGVERLAAASAPPGRLEVTAREPAPVILDYAHTPDALARVLETLRPLYPGRLIVVFGAGGDRDRAKRPEMGRVAARGADIPIVTSDNPRTEDPEAIVDDIISGMGAASHHRIVDRREAIATALEMARPGDAVLLAGKGHETYQVMGTQRRPFDEREVVRSLLEGRGAGA
jgi:UDP-N-acetylmuramoyl-L-alanyl-D-glutamate--2,6-diaminopimelate ligase